jgi:hypothetical protein
VGRDEEEEEEEEEAMRLFSSRGKLERALAHLYITKKLLVVRRPALVVSTALPKVALNCLGVPQC